MSLNRADLEYHPLAIDKDETSIPRPQKQRQGLARVFERYYVPLLLLIGLVVGLGFGRIGVDRPAVSFSYGPVPTIFDFFLDINHESPAVHHPKRTLTKPHERAVVTSLYNDGHALGVAIMGYSLSKVKSQARKIVIYLPERISEGTLCRVRAMGWEPFPVDRIPPPNNGVGIWSGPVDADQYTKLRIWTLDRLGIKTAVYLDTNVLVLKNFDELFELPFVFAAVPDVGLGKNGFTVGFNAGVLAVKPNSKVFEDMLLKVEDAKFNRVEAEQSYLNSYYGSQVVRLPHVYNGNLAIKEKSRSYWAALQEQMRTIHYTLVKPFDHEPWCGDKPCEGGEVFDISRQEDLLEDAKETSDGRFREEIERWIEERDEMMSALGGSCA